MKKKIMRFTAFVLVMVMMIPFVSGCGESKQAKKVVFSVNGTDVTLDEVWLYCKSVQEYYEQYYSSMFSSPQVWTSSYPVEKDDGTTEDSTLENVAKRSAIKQIRQIKLASSYADKKKVTLTNAEQKKVKEQVDNFMSKVTKDEKKQMGISDSLVEKVFTESAKVEKLKEKLAKDEGIEISDEDAQTSKIYYIYFPTTAYDKTSGKSVTASKDNKKKALTDAEDALERVQAGNDIATVAAAYGMTGSSGETSVNTDTDLPEEISKAVAGLKDGEVYDKVVAASDGYYIIKMEKVIDEQATADRKEELLGKKEQELLDKKFKEWTKDEKFDYDTDVKWKYMDEIDFVKNSTVTTTEAATTKEDASTQGETTTKEASTQEDTKETTTEASTTQDSTQKTE